MSNSDFHKLKNKIQSRTLTKNIETLFEGVCNTDMTKDEIANALLGIMEINKLQNNEIFKIIENIEYPVSDNEELDEIFTPRERHEERQ